MSVLNWSLAILGIFKVHCWLLPFNPTKDSMLCGGYAAQRSSLVAERLYQVGVVTRDRALDATGQEVTARSCVESTAALSGRIGSVAWSDGWIDEDDLRTSQVGVLLGYQRPAALQIVTDFEEYLKRQPG
ncbi:uncharacterized protein P884DRAFT_268051 [Thermothelomyces heterothallicus CBS 202.75]|uniref:uncharacterized protein n=1 Tax=Thermothelomyces heterothallicus CBS 202.75 TaxID=1149848 RepID=UPI00374417B6